MKKKINMQTGIIAVVLSIFLLAGCINQFEPHVSQGTLGQGIVTINIGNGETSRTLFPNTPEFSRYKLEFTPLDGQDAKGDEWVTSTNPVIALEAGNWEISVTAYLHIHGLESQGILDDEYEAAWGSDSLMVLSGESNSLTIDIKGEVDNDGQGIFNYDISLPDSMDTAVMKILSLSGELEKEIGLLTAGISGDLVLDSNYYILRLELENEHGRIVKVEVIHIYKNMTTSAKGASYTFTESDFFIIQPVPSAPSTPVLSAGNNEISVSWEAVNGAVSYDVQYRRDNEAFQFHGGAVTGTSVTITGLNSNTQYYVRVRARNISGAGDWSNEAGVTTTTAIPGTSDTPAVTAGSGEISVSWNAVANASSYEVWYRNTEEGGEGLRFMSDDTITETGIIIGGLENGIAYQVRIRAVNTSGSSEFSNWSVARTPDASLPPAPAMPVAANITFNEVTISWESVPRADAYSVWLATENNPNEADRQGQWVDASDDRSMDITGLDAGTAYYIWVRARNADALPGAYSPALKFNTPLPTPVITSITPAKERLTVYWNEEANDSAYDVYLSTESSSDPNFNVPTATVIGYQSATIEELTPSQTYYVWVRAKRDNNGEWVFSDWSSQSQERVPNNATTLSNFRLGSSSNYINMMSVPVPDGGITFPTGLEDTGRGTILSSYQIGETVVTWELWNTVRTWAVANGYSMNTGRMGSSGSGSDQQPVTRITWYDALVWCNALTEYWNAISGASLETVYNSGGNPIRSTSNTSVLNSVTPSANATGFRLPTSLEWELAARWRNDSVNTVSGFSNPWFTRGDSASGATADFNNINDTNNVSVNNGNSGSTMPVKSKAPNSLGLYDMSGNVWEWCFNINGSTRISRGGAYDNPRQHMRIGYEHNDSPDFIDANSTRSFRLVRNGTFEENLIYVTVPYAVNISSIQAYFDLSFGAQADFSSGSNGNFTAPKDIIVTAEDGETTAEYTVIVTVNTPIEIGFERENDALDSGSGGDATITANGVYTLSAPEGFSQYKWLLNNTTVSTDNVLYLKGVNAIKNENEQPIDQTAPVGAIIVNNFSVDNAATEGTLRHAIANAQSGSVIWIDAEPGVTVIELTGRLDINTNITIYGNGITITRSASWTTVDANSQLLLIDYDTAVYVSRIHFKDGIATQQGGAIRNEGTLTLESCIFSGNRTTTNNQFNGGALYNWGTMNVTGCTFYNNSANQGAVIFLGRGNLVVTGNLFYGNTASAGSVVYRGWESHTITSNGYNIVDVPFGTGSSQSGWNAATGDKIVNNLSFSTDTFIPILDGGADNILSPLPANYPTVDFYGYQIKTEGAAGAVSQEALFNPLGFDYDEAVTLNIGPNTITLLAYKDEGGKLVPYSKTITVTVTP